MKIILLAEQKKTKISFCGKTIEDLLKSQEINIETVLIKKNDEFVTEDEKLKEEDVVELISVVSKG
ncbi:MAG: MoaD/ThiS family protein [Candidatus Aenigmarchaeota archaeon]|nr:MoaD/ThiS family protein [Candidatus Aenigmarchaeota archaeon]